MSKKRSKKMFLRLTAVFLALFMVIGAPAKAFAAEDFTSPDEFIEEVEDFVETDEEDEIITEEEEFAEPEEEDSEEAVIESIDEPETEEVTESEEISLSFDEDGVAVEDSDEDATFVEIPNEDDASRALRILYSQGAFTPGSMGANISETAYSVKRYADHVSVSNKATGDKLEDYLFVALVRAEDSPMKFFILGTGIAPGKSIDLAVAYDHNNNKSVVDANTDYVLWMGKADNSTDSETGEVRYYDFKVLGYIPQYDEHGNLILVDGEPQYEKAEMDEISLPHSESYDGYDGTWKDGYSGIGMTALIQKNLKSVKVSWKPDTKNKPEQKEYKKYELYHLEADAKEETGYKETLLKATTSKSFTIKDVKVQEDSLLYLLKCLDKEGKVLAEYVTTAAPYMVQMQSGDSTGNFDFVMTKRPDTAQLYMLQLAPKNKEKTDKIPNGFQSDWTTVYQVEDGFNDSNSIGSFFINKTTTPEVIQLDYNAGAPEVTLGTTYYGRVMTATYINGLQVTSAPSNVLSCKAGPSMCYILTTAGVYYDANNAKKGGNVNNIERANEHLNSYLTGEEISSKSEIYVHDHDTGICAKDGLIYFIVDKDTSNIKSFDLLKCNTENGTYKKVKNYTFKNAALMECTVESDFFNDIKVFAIYYNNFVPEKDAYYAVRAISSTKNTPGGHGIGERIVPEMDVAHGLVTSDSGPNKIQLTWVADDCVKQYWLYRSEKSINGAERTRAGQNGDTLIAKIGIGNAKKYTYALSDDTTDTKTIKIITYADKKNIKIDTPYYYYVRPVYNTKEATSDSSKYIEYCSDEVKGKASALYAQIGNFKAANEAIGKMKVSFNQVKSVTNYRVFRLEVDGTTKKLTDEMKPDLSALYEEAYKQDYDNFADFEEYISRQPESVWREIITKAGADGNHWQYVDTVKTDGTKTSAKGFIDTGVEVGSYYFYLVQGATDISSSMNFTYSSRVRNVPLPVTSVKATYSDNGIMLSWSLNSKDKDNVLSKYLTVQVSTNGGKSWNDASKTGYTDRYLSRGEERTYQIRVRYNDGYTTVYSSTSSVSYSLPSGIELSKASEAGVLTENTFTIKKGEIGKISYRAYLNNGNTASYNNIARSETPEGNSTVVITGSDANSFTFEARETGRVTYYLSCAGITRSITIVVTN